MGDCTEELSEEDAAGRAEDEGYETENDDLQGRYIQESFRGSGGADRGTQQNDDDVHHRIGSGLLQLTDNAGLTEEVSEHQHADQGSRRGKDQADHRRNDDGEENLLQLRNRAKVLHLDGPLLLRRQELHDRGLNDGHEGHIGICRHGNGAHQGGLAQFSCQEDGGRSVSAADDGYGCSCLIRETHQDGQEVCQINTELGGCPHQERDGVCNQGPEIRHGPDAHENQGREDGPLVQLEEIPQ